jgi:hypothetical protein
MYVIEVRNAELIESLTKQAAEQGITDAAIVALIGAIDRFTVSTNPAGDATAHAPAGRGRINDTRVPLAPPATDTPPVPAPLHTRSVKPHERESE